ncbi:HAMP domain-containing sensor histidine kinase [Pseudonocardia nematodicida]|uniref:histidine kinase n=1 Tax=Pseudonocardia nematodicida TaxID=1206997 RepID=A0ABV1KF57_9PSEU
MTVHRPHSADAEPQAGPGTGTVRATSVRAPDRPASRPVRRRLFLPARLRIVGWCTLLLIVTLFSVGLAVRNLLQADAVRSVHDGLVQETREFLRVAESGRDPITGAPTVDAVQLMEGHLLRQYPHDGELLFGIAGDGRVLTQPDRPPSEAEQREVIAPIVAEAGEGGRLETSAGPVLWSSVRVVDDSGEPAGTYVIASEVTPHLASAEAVTRAVMIVSGGGVLIAALASWIIAGQILRPVNAVRKAAERITHEDLTQRIEVVGHDDVAALAMQFNAMLDRLEGAFRVQREFLDDASHELRTPITIVRGNLELLGDDDPAERAEVVRLCGGELDRMSRIVEDLLLLAKSEQPDFVSPRRTDLLELTTDVAAKLQRLGDRRWRIDDLPEGEAMLDPQRITQALVQLAQNAVQHTGPGDRIALGAVVRGPDVVFRVADTGHGVTPDDAEAIFQRFSRGATHGGSRGLHTGAGLGLAIVTAIAEAHGGRVELDSRPGAGATFSIRLPGAAGGAGDVPTDRIEGGAWTTS